MNVKRILCPIDFSDHSAAVIAYASTLANEANATLLLVHVNDTQGTDETLQHLHATLPTMESVAHEHHLLIGSPADKIVEFAQSNEIDLIVMATYGQTGITRLPMGSVAAEVVLRADCPVLTLKQPTNERKNNVTDKPCVPA